MSDTPITDSTEMYVDSGMALPFTVVASELCRVLERENAALHTKRGALLAENADLQADKERLDWLAVSDKWFKVPATESFTPKTFRAAIDAARKEQP